MFTGIIETLATLKKVETEGTNRHFFFESPITNELKIDQSVAHNGVCLTVVAIEGNQYQVTAIDETLQKTNLHQLVVGSIANIERCLLANSRFDGHIVQGHVDGTAKCVDVKDENGSWVFTFDLDEKINPAYVVDKGSICINGISLTVVSCIGNQVKVAIIPYTYLHTNLHQVKVGKLVNIELDIVGKYIAKMMQK